MILKIPKHTWIILPLFPYLGTSLIPSQQNPLTSFNILRSMASLMTKLNVKRLLRKENGFDTDLPQ